MRKLRKWIRPTKLALTCCECGRVQNEPTRRCEVCNAPVQRQRVEVTAERAA